MRPVSRQADRYETDQVSVAIIPERSLDTEVPNLHWLFGEANGCGFASRLTDDSSADSKDCAGFTKAEATVMSEVTDWLESHEYDGFWAPRTKKARAILPTATQLLLRLKNPHHLPGTPSSNAEAFDVLLRTIALQLLASCYTSLPVSSAGHISLFQPRKGTVLVTALQLHSRYRFSPAAGHHARASSEISASPGVYAGSSPEDTFAEAITQKPLFKKSSSEYIPHFAGSGWTDGPPPTKTHNDRRGSQLLAISSSSSEHGIVSRLTCQASIPNNLRSKHSALCMNCLFARKKKQQRPQRPQAGPLKAPRARSNPIQSLTSQALLRIPSAFRLRRTQSAPRISRMEPSSVSDPCLFRSYSSNSSKESSRNFSFEIPEIRRISATPAASQSCLESVGTVRTCGRDDLITAQEHLDKTQMTKFDSAWSESHTS